MVHQGIYNIRIIRKAFVCFLSLLCLLTVPAEASEYEILPLTDLITGGSTVGLVVTSELLTGKPEIAELEENINLLDRLAIYSHNQDVDTVSTIGAYAALAIPALSVVNQLQSVETLITYALMYTEAFLLTMATKNLLKDAVSRHRPYTYRGDIPPGDVNDYFNSFPSGHTSFAFLGATFLSQTFYTDFPSSSLRLPILIGSYSLASAIGVLRIISGNHFITDAISGAIIGAFYGWLIPRLHLTKNEHTDISLSPSPQGVSLSIHY